MTAADAKRELEAALHEHVSCRGNGNECPTCEAMRHALVALADRAALVEAYPESVMRGTVPRSYDAARSHMEGQP